MRSSVLSFIGGIHPSPRKGLTDKKEIEVLKPPKFVTIPLLQHIGDPCEPLVKKGDAVKRGQKIGEPKGFIGAPIHSSVSGVVKSIETLPHPTSGKSMAVVIENDGKYENHNSISEKNVDILSKEEIIETIKEAGIVGMGGAECPTHVKLTIPPESTVDTIILNGAECEPYLTSDHRLMLERADDIIYGLRVIMKTLEVKKAYIGIEDNKLDAIKTMEGAAFGHAGIEIITLKTKYPQGAEKQLIDAITGREVPSGGLPRDIGVVVNNIGTAAAISNAIRRGMPLIERVITVTGKGISEPKNLLVPIGTQYSYIVEQCGGLKDDVKKVICGGPMMGVAQYTLDVPVIKGTTGIIFLTSDDVQVNRERACIRCAKCVEACPVYLMPLMINAYSRQQDYETCDKLNAIDCIECGACSYVCPSKIPLLQNIRTAKYEIINGQDINI
ncbi:MAG: electron transport complex subunit RsxC [Clostridiales bacterium]|nr:electron transport complex subunit RsxC [Clostridiales bacterium]